MGIAELLSDVSLIIDAIFMIFMVIVWRATEDKNARLTCWIVWLIMILNMAALMIR